MGSFALIIGVAVVAAIAGFVGGQFVVRYGQRRPTGLTVADLVQRVVHSSHSGVTVLNKFGDVVLHNPKAADLGVVRGNVADDRARKAAEQAIDQNCVVHVDLSPLEHRGRQPEAVLAEVRSLGDGFTVVDASDQSDTVRLEATRRDFVANVSHELKTPVGALALLAEAVLDAVDDPEEVKRFSTKILREATRLGHLVTELIALSRLQGAERLPELASVQVDDLVDEALGRCRLAAESAGIEITVDDPSGMVMHGDRTLLVTALSNLVDNAISYSPVDSPVSVSRRQNGEFVEIAVTDRGIGIAVDHQQRVFERFFRVDPARSRATGGTGLGLAIVKHVAANHGGEVKLWSRPGTGSTFTMRIPCEPGTESDRETSLVPSHLDGRDRDTDSAPTPAAIDHGGVL
ncbi:sensor histidine kinase [Pseudonocardiaceae bacterium YIM PH 21723]|nr:sensor histidine kinase [Pseudonocardiaceae bacterium YIM PH 21723]